MYKPTEPRIVRVAMTDGSSDLALELSRSGGKCAVLTQRHGFWWIAENSVGPIDCLEQLAVIGGLTFRCVCKGMVTGLSGGGYRVEVVIGLFDFDAVGYGPTVEDARRECVAALRQMCGAMPPGAEIDVAAEDDRIVEEIAPASNQVG
jgi:hypothetical protein